MTAKGLLFYAPILVFGAILLNLNACTNNGPSAPSPKHVLLESNAWDYVDEFVDWINRDGWNSDDGSKEENQGVSYNFFTSDNYLDFTTRINQSKIDSQVYWHQYRSYRPGGRNTDPQQVNWQWTGTACQGLVYHSAIAAGYSIGSSYLNCIDCWADLGTEVFQGALREGDLVLMDFDSTDNYPSITYSHLGIVSTPYPTIISAVGIYMAPFYYKAGHHTIQDYNNALTIEFQNLLPPGHPGYKVYNTKFIRLPE